MFYYEGDGVIFIDLFFRENDEKCHCLCTYTNTERNYRCDIIANTTCTADITDATNKSYKSNKKGSGETEMLQRPQLCNVHYITLNYFTRCAVAVL